MACDCWAGYGRVPGVKPCAPGSCRKLSVKNAKRRLARMKGKKK